MSLMKRSKGALASARAPSRGLWHACRREALYGDVFMLPAIIGLVVFLIGPIVVSLYLSFTNYNIISEARWIGVDNYTTLFQDGLFWQAWRVSAIYSVVSVPLGLMLSLFAAVLLNHKMRGITIFRSIYYLPTVISGVGVAMLWRWMFNGEYGMINALLGYVGIDGPSWITNERWAATDYQTTIASDRDWIPIQREARESMTNQEGMPPGMQQALAAISDARLGDIYHRNGQKILAKVLGPTLEQLFNNNITPEEAARQIDEKANPLLQAA